jgi:CUE domain
MLAKDAPAAEDDAESQPAMQSLDIPKHVSADDDHSTSIPQPSETEDEIDEMPKIDFLMRCFPDIPRDELETALQEQDGDLQSATDIILNDMFLKEEEVSSDDVDIKTDNVPGRFLNNLDDMLADNNDQISQKQPRQIRKTQGQKNKKTVIWDSGGLNAASIRNGTYPQPLTLAPLEPNRWLEYEKEVSELAQLFPRFSKTVINTTVKRFQGNLLECVDQLSRLTNTSPLLLTNQNWEELRKVHNAIDQAKLLLPGRDENEIKRLVVGATLQGKILNMHDQGEVVQMAVDLILNRERDREKEQIMIEERLQELTLYAKKEIKFDPLTGEIVSEEFPMLANDRVEAKLRAAEAAKEIRAIPEYLLINNTEEYIEDDPEECRDIAFNLVLQRNEVYRKAADAYRRAKGKTNGEGGIAYYYSDEVRDIHI